MPSAAAQDRAVEPLTRLVPRLTDAWARSDALFGMLRPQAWLARPIALRHPFAFYAGHLPAFAWNQIGRGVLGRPPVDTRLDALYARGIDPMDDAATPAAASWPDESEARRYRDRARDAVLAAVESLPEKAPHDPLADGARVLHLVIEHELMHHETLLYMMQELPHALKAPGDGALANGHTSHASHTDGHVRESTPRQVTIPAGRARLGATFHSVAFGWDNEFDAHDVDVDAFAIDAMPVRNAEFLEFVEAGGYRRSDLWDAIAFAWLRRQRIEQPHGWQSERGARTCRTLWRDRPFREVAEWPAQVSHAEAAAYARWRGAALPTEAQIHRAAFCAPDGSLRAYPWGDAAPAAAQTNAGFRRWSPEPVGSRPEGASGFGVHELVGNGWEWTSTPFAPYPGFRAWARTYPGYSKDFFDGQHFVLVGASWATDEKLVRRSFRNWFQPHYPYVFSKFRCVAPA